jgi:hypothetical protein
MDHQHGKTPNEVARLLRVAPDQVRAWIKTGLLGAIDTSRHRCGRPRYVILPEHLREFVESRKVSPPQPKAPRRPRRPEFVDYYPD